MLMPFAVSAVFSRGEELVHELRVMEAKTADHAEARVLQDGLRDGLHLVGLQSMPSTI